MTLTKNYENYLVKDTFDNMNVDGYVEKRVDGEINISINIDGCGNAHYGKDISNNINFNFSYGGDKDIIDYARGLVENILQELVGDEKPNDTPQVTEE